MNECGPRRSSDGRKLERESESDNEHKLFVAPLTYILHVPITISTSVFNLISSQSCLFPSSILIYSSLSFLPCHDRHPFPMPRSHSRYFGTGLITVLYIVTRRLYGPRAAGFDRWGLLSIVYGSFLVPLCDFFLFVLPTLKLVKSTLKLEKSTLMSIKSTLKLVKSTLMSIKSTLKLILPTLKLIFQTLKS